ncbi:hypothetical protein LZC95_04170 [Pendulispora brunnea]|uniref:Uncharacterized protein n=1 Tax=Pendulispora brunnea TaxID=2905690 RepID=A0ABZ2KD69_9BACT
MTPNTIALRCLIPLYNLYWSFIVNRAACQRIDQLRARRRLPRTAPRILAILCPLIEVIRHILPFFMRLSRASWFILATVLPLLWIAYMFRAERALAEAHSAKKPRRVS